MRSQTLLGKVVVLTRLNGVPLTWYFSSLAAIFNIAAVEVSDATFRRTSSHREVVGSRYRKSHLRALCLFIHSITEWI